MVRRSIPLLAGTCILFLSPPTLADEAEAAHTPGPVTAPALPAASVPVAAPTPATAPAPQDESSDEAKLGPDYRVPMLATDVVLMGAFAGSWTLGRGHTIPSGAAFAGVAG